MRLYFFHKFLVNAQINSTLPNTTKDVGFQKADGVIHVMHPPDTPQNPTPHDTNEPIEIRQTGQEIHIIRSPNISQDQTSHDTNDSLEIHQSVDERLPSSTTPQNTAEHPERYDNQ